MELAWLGLAMLISAMLIFDLGGDERVGVGLYLGASLPFAVRTLKWRRGWMPGS
jgi:hypothetical protein